MTFWVTDKLNQIKFEKYQIILICKTTTSSPFSQTFVQTKNIVYHKCKFMWIFWNCYWKISQPVFFSVWSRMKCADDKKRFFLQVSWVRHRDIHLLTVGIDTYTSDQRFVATHSPITEEWKLHVKFPQKRDSGWYECQISTTPPTGHILHLSVVG